MTEQIWQGTASEPTELAGEIAAMPTQIVRLPYVEPIEVVTVTMSIANRDLVTAALRCILVLKGYEKWEADIILERECWKDEFVQLTPELYDRMMELQTARNLVLGDVGEQST